MANATTGVPGPISTMPLFTGIFAGTEALPIVVPPFGQYGSNQRITTQLLAQLLPPLVVGEPTILTASTLYTALTTDFEILYSRSAGVATTTLQLPASSTRNGQSLVIVDIAGNAASFPINIVPSVGENISGLSPASINSNYGGFRIVPLAAGWYISP